MSNPEEQDEFHPSFWNLGIKDLIRDLSPLLGCDVTRLWKLHLILVICFLLRDMLSPPPCFLFPLNSLPLREEQRYSNTLRKIHAVL